MKEKEKCIKDIQKKENSFLKEKCAETKTIEKYVGENSLKSQTEVTVQRTYKARLFEMIFSDKKELLELYNAEYQSRS